MIGLYAIVFFFVFSFVLTQGLKTQVESLEREEKKNDFLYLSQLRIPSFEPPSLSYEEEVETALNRACQIGQAWIIRCQECVLQTGSVFSCPYPTVSFCQSALGRSINDWALLWGFLPSNTGSLLDIWNAPAVNPNTMTNVNQIPQGVRWIIRNTFPRADWQNFRYVRPVPRSSGFPCGVEGVVSR